jgi:hypothetical protein
MSAFMVYVRDRILDPAEMKIHETAHRRRRSGTPSRRWLSTVQSRPWKGPWSMVPPLSSFHRWLTPEPPITIRVTRKHSSTASKAPSIAFLSPKACSTYSSLAWLDTLIVDGPLLAISGRGLRQKKTARRIGPFQLDARLIWHRPRPVVRPPPAQQSLAPPPPFWWHQRSHRHTPAGTSPAGYIS